MKLNSGIQVERKDPKYTTIRNLFTLSGNQCAFPGCDVTLFDGVNYLAEVCHIEAAKPGGPRFNEKMTEETRRDINNLIILCRNHHKETDNIQIYTVAKLHEMKRNHELKFKNLRADLASTIHFDITKEQLVIYPHSLSSINKELNWRQNEEELSISVELAKRQLKKLQFLTPKTRSIFATMIDRSEEEIFLLHVIRKVLNLTNTQLNEAIDELRRYDLIDEPYVGEKYSELICEFTEEDDWIIWIEIKKYCDKLKIDLTKIINEMNFECLDVMKHD